MYFKLLNVFASYKIYSSIVDARYIVCPFNLTIFTDSLYKLLNLYQDLYEKIQDTFTVC
jgi:hypothetical protein